MERQLTQYHRALLSSPYLGRPASKSPDPARRRRQAQHTQKMPVTSSSNRDRVSSLARLLQMPLITATDAPAVPVLSEQEARADAHWVKLERERKQHVLSSTGSALRRGLASREEAWASPSSQKRAEQLRQAAEARIQGFSAADKQQPQPGL